VAAKLAEVKQLALERVAEATSANFATLFLAANSKVAAPTSTS